MSSELIIHSERIRPLIKARYRRAEIEALCQMLRAHGTLEFPRYATGLFPALGANAPGLASGYDRAWVRDNCHIAFAHHLGGRTEVAITAARALARFFDYEAPRLERIIDGVVAPEAEQRPQVRFDGRTLAEVDEPWANAQNDALGYFLWLYAELATARVFTPRPWELETLARVTLYLERIRYWEDADNGHWEETPKVEASSIGVAFAGLLAVQRLLRQRTELAQQFRYRARAVDPERLDDSIAAGEQALAELLPWESLEPERRYDAALLFLVFPVGSVDETMASRIVEDVTTHLLGSHGIRRYPGDSYWLPDYTEHFPPDERAGDFSEDMERRDTLLAWGEEAQWCLFDPVLSVIYARRFRKGQAAEDLEGQVWHLNRALGQLTDDAFVAGGLRCPEAYYRAHGCYVPNDNTPLLWTQANLWQALMAMDQTARLLER